MSLSTGELRFDGPLATYELRMPIYEIVHVAHPETDLVDHVRFRGALRVSSWCRADPDTYVCVATYEFAHPVDSVDVDCTLFEVTVPNHVHLLTAISGANTDQAVFDRTITQHTLHLRPPSAIEQLARPLLAGMARVFLSPVALFLIALAIAARSRREAGFFIAMYLAGEWLMRPIAPFIPWPLTPRFLEAAMALTVAYLAVEILALPKARNRAPIVLVLGLFHGLYFASFPILDFAGATLLQALLIAALSLLFLHAPRRTPRPMNRYAAIALLAFSLFWFTLRLVAK
ncbi:MAG TPA: HupE/UreJ family protein [Bryobacteraceae bacterium]|nr:HupE/UreJ family protein [Bryobacteraceae bacterium]